MGKGGAASTTDFNLHVKGKAADGATRSIEVLSVNVVAHYKLPLQGFKKNLQRGIAPVSHTPAFLLTHTRLSHLLHVVSTQETITVINRPK